MKECTPISAEATPSVVDLTKFIEQIKRIQSGTELLGQLMRQQRTFTAHDLSGWKCRLEHWKQVLPVLSTFIEALPPVENDIPFTDYALYFGQQLDRAIDRLKKEVPTDGPGRVDMHYEALRFVLKCNSALIALLKQLESMPPSIPLHAGHIQRLAPIPSLSIPNGAQDLLADIYLLDAIGSPQDIQNAQQLIRQYLKKIVSMHPGYIELG